MNLKAAADELYKHCAYGGDLHEATRAVVAAALGDTVLYERRLGLHPDGNLPKWVRIWPEVDDRP